MNNEDIVTNVKNDIIKDLFSNVGKDKCIIDAYLEKSNRFNIEKLNKVSVLFLDSCKKELMVIHDKGQILFFRVKDYEKCLDRYLSGRYLSDISSLHDEKRINRTENKIQKPVLTKKQKSTIENQKSLEEKNRIKKEHEKEMEIIINSVSELKWKKRIGVSAIHYDSSFNNQSICFKVITSTNNKESTITYAFTCEKKKIGGIWNPERILEQILATQPAIEKNNKVIVIISQNNSRLHPEEKNEPVLTEKEVLALQKRKKREEKRVEERRSRLEALRKNEKLEKEERARLNKLREEEEKECKLDKECKAEKERLLQEKLQKLPRIGVKDFIVRRSVFKCMHDNHKVIDLDAAITIFDYENNERLVKISAGYCESCGVYFIMESTYQSLKRKGIILCRISDEKSYMKNSFVNGMKLAQESILMQYGYNVSQDEGLTATRRQKILAIMVDKHILSRSEIISYLDFFINQRMYQSKFELAASKWEADRDFIREYRLGEYSQYGVNAIYRR